MQRQPLTTPAKLPIDDGLIMDLPLNEGSGRLCKDLSGFNGDCTLDGVTWGAAKGKRGFAATLDGIDDKGSFTKNMIPSSGDFTMMGWIYCEGDQAGNTDYYGAAFGAVDIDSFLRGVAIRRSDSYLRISYGDGTATGLIPLVTSITTSKAKTWFHVAAVYQAATTTMSGFVDADLKNSSSSVACTSAPVNFEVGHSSLAPTMSYWYGQIKGVRVYNRVVSAGELRRIVERGI